MTNGLTDEERWRKAIEDRRRRTGVTGPRRVEPEPRGAVGVMPDFPEPYELEDTDTGEIIEARLERDQSVWVGEEQVGVHDRRTDTFQPITPPTQLREQAFEELLRGEPSALRPPVSFKPLEDEFALPRKEMGMGEVFARYGYPGIIPEILEKVTGLPLTGPAPDIKLPIPSWRQWKSWLTQKDKPETFEPATMSDEEVLDFLGFVGFVAPASALPAAVVGWRALAGASLPVKIAGRTALAPFVAAEWLVGQAAKWTIGKPISFVFGQAVKARGAVAEKVMRSDFRKTPVYQGMKPEFKGTALEDDIFSAYKLWRQGKTQPAEQVMDSVFKGFAAGRYGTPVKPTPKPPTTAEVTPKLLAAKAAKVTPEPKPMKVTPSEEAIKVELAAQRVRDRLGVKPETVGLKPQAQREAEALQRKVAGEKVAPEAVPEVTFKSIEEAEPVAIRAFGRMKATKGRGGRTSLKVEEVEALRLYINEYGIADSRFLGIAEVIWTGDTEIVLGVFSHEQDMATTGGEYLVYNVKDNTFGTHATPPSLTKHIANLRTGRTVAGTLTVEEFESGVKDWLAGKIPFPAPETLAIEAAKPPAVEKPVVKKAPAPAAEVTRVPEDFPTYADYVASLSVKERFDIADSIQKEMVGLESLNIKVLDEISELRKIKDKTEAQQKRFTKLEAQTDSIQDRTSLLAKQLTELRTPSKPPAVAKVKAEEQVTKAPEEVIVTPPKQITSLARKQEITRLLASPVKELPKGTSKIALKQELTRINAKLVPEEKKLRSQIMTQVKNIGLPQSQYREIFRDKGGSRWLTQVTIERLPRVLDAVAKARPKLIRGKKVITTKTEELIQASKQELIDDGILTEATYQDILKALKLKTDKYVSKELFISQSDGAGIIREMRNRAILAPLGELKFGKPTAIKNLTSQTYYAQILGVKPLVEPLELAKVDFDLAHRAMAGAIDREIIKVDKAWGVGTGERLQAKVEGKLTKGVTQLRDLLDKFEEAPAELTEAQKEVFNWFRNLNRTIINGENEVRKALGMPEIAYREAYVRHVPDAMAEEILRGTHPLPPSLEYWSRKIVSKKIFNPMEFHRQLSDDLAKLYTRDLARAAKNMVYTGLKEIHLAQPLRAFTERMGALSDVMPAPTRKWVTDYVNQVIKGQQTEWDANLNRLVTENGIGRLINNVLAPYNLSLGTQPVTKLAQVIGRGTLLAVLALPRPGVVRLMIRNAFQRTQELALHNPTSILKGFLFEQGKLKELMGKSRFLKSYTGVEEWPTELMAKVEKIVLGPYQTTAVINARQAMRTTYHDVLPFFTQKKYKDLGWASPKRTYAEAKDFLYPEEEALMLKEMEWAARATQYQYIGMGMPEIFRNKTLIPLTRLQSWWMNHFFMFHREAAHRFLYGETGWGGKLPWTKRVNYLTYLLLGGAILTSMGYSASYLWKVLPHNLSPVGQFMAGLLTLVSADSEWQREKGKREIFSAWKAMIPGPLAYDEFNRVWTGEKPLWSIFFYGREEEGIPPRPPTWGIINRQPAIDLKEARKDITEAEKQLGQAILKEVPDPYYYLDEQGEQQLYKPIPEEYAYTTVDLGAAIRNATLKLEDKDITAGNGFSPLALFYKEAEGMWGAYYYNLPASQRTEFRESPDGAFIEAYLFFWGKLGVLRNDSSEEIVRGWMEKYDMPAEALPNLKKVR